MEEDRIDRSALVRRHNPIIRNIEPLSPLSVGNGEFAFTADLTGLQSFPEHYKVPLGTQSNWAWHSTGGTEQHRLNELRLKNYDTQGRQVGYPVEEHGQEEPFHWLRQNPHRLQLTQIGLRLFHLDGRRVAIQDLHDVEQQLDMWKGVLTSYFQVEGMPVKVQTCCHPKFDQLGVRIESPLIAQNRVKIAIGFPSPNPVSSDWTKTIGLYWHSDDTHQTCFHRCTNQSAVFERTMDQDGYQVFVQWSSGEILQDDEHQFCLHPKGAETSFEIAIGFSPAGQVVTLPAFHEILDSSSKHWENFWREGGAVELAGSQDPRALELERRIVLSQFLTAIHCAGSLPPQETGLLYTSWFGKFHLEMHWWHAVHFALWGRTHLLRKSMDWYKRIVPKAKKFAHSQGYKGARWPKMVGPDGNDSPSPIGPLLIWQQPHPIVLAELCYLADPTPKTLEYFRDVVFESAEFMASFAVWEVEHQRYVLGPPVIPAQEEHRAEETWNPTFELEYWRHALELAQKWRKRLNFAPDPKWQHVLEHLSVLPEAAGVYLAHENCPDTFARVNTDHPSMLGALGMLPGHAVNHELMRTTLKRVMKDWQWTTAWGWDFPMVALTAARLGEGEIAVDALLMDTQKNTYLLNGHNYQRGGLTAYLPGNGGLLTAVAVMACGWLGGDEQTTPGFPRDGSWRVRWEGLNAWL